MNASALITYAKNALANDWGYIWGTSGQMWTASDQKALEKTTDEDRAMSRKYGSKWIGHYVCDCSGLIYRPCKNAGVAMPHGSHTMYISYCSKKGKLISGKRDDGQKLKPGTAVFTYNTKTGRYGHVGLYVGDGLVIEAKGTQSGVVTSKPEHWGFWGELKGITYDGGGDDPTPTPPEPDPGEDRPTLRKGSKGEYVTLLQTKLLSLGYSLPKYGADGSYGNETVEAVKMFQRENSLTADGICGKKTWAALDNSEPMKLYTVTIPHLPLYKAEAFVNSYDNATMKEE